MDQARRQHAQQAGRLLREVGRPLAAQRRRLGGAIEQPHRGPDAVVVVADVELLVGRVDPIVFEPEAHEQRVEAADALAGCEVLGGDLAVGQVGDALRVPLRADAEAGEIARLTDTVGPKVTNLQLQLGRLAKQLGIASVLIGVAIVFLGTSVGRPLFDMFMTGLSLAVAIVPEGLPAVLGCDGSGVVLEAGDAATRFRPSSLAR